MGWRRPVARTAWAPFTEFVRDPMELRPSRSFTRLRAARMEPQARLEGWSSAMGICTERRLSVALMEAELFSSLRPGIAESGISARFIRSEASRTGVFPMVRCFSMAWVTFTERLITAEPMVSALFTSYLHRRWANGTRAYSIASKKEATATVPSAILFLTRLAISMELRVKVAWAVEPFLS